MSEARSQASNGGKRFDVEAARRLLREREEEDRQADPTRRGAWLTRPQVEIALRDACDEIERLRNEWPDEEDESYTMSWAAK